MKMIIQLIYVDMIRHFDQPTLHTNPHNCPQINDTSLLGRITYKDTMSNIKHNPRDNNTKWKDNSNIKLTRLPEM